MLAGTWNSAANITREASRRRRRPGVTASGRRALLLTAVLGFLLAGSGVGRWLRRRERAKTRSWATCSRVSPASRRGKKWSCAARGGAPGQHPPSQARSGSLPLRCSPSPTIRDRTTSSATSPRAGRSTSRGGLEKSYGMPVAPRARARRNDQVGGRWRPRPKKLRSQSVQSDRRPRPQIGFRRSCGRICRRAGFPRSTVSIDSASAGLSSIPASG
jgi:hypothetical protein